MIGPKMHISAVEKVLRASMDRFLTEGGIIVGEHFGLDVFECYDADDGRSVVWRHDRFVSGDSDYGGSGCACALGAWAIVTQPPSGFEELDGEDIDDPDDVVVQPVVEEEQAIWNAAELVFGWSHDETQWFVCAFDGDGDPGVLSDAELETFQLGQRLRALYVAAPLPQRALPSAESAQEQS